MKQKSVNSTEAHYEIEFFVEENPGTPVKQPAKPLPGHGGVEKRPVESIGVRPLTGIATVTLLIVTTLARAFGGPSLLALVTACAAGLLILSGYQRINRKLRVTSCILFAASLLALPFARDPIAALERGVSVAGLLLSVTASVMLIARCAVQSHRVGLIGSWLREKQGSRRYLAFALTSQFFSGILGLAGANMLFIMAAPPGSGRSETRTAAVVAVSRGFASASCWSPVFGNMAILLALYPSLHWSTVFPVGLALGQLTIVVGALMHRRSELRRGGPPAQPQPVPASAIGSNIVWAALPVLISLLGLLAVILFVSKAFHIVISAAIVLLGPVISLLFNTAMGKPGHRLADGVTGLGRGMQQFPALASEAVLFIAAGCAGSILADAFPRSWVIFIGQALSGHPFWALGFLLSGIMVTALAGIHPLLAAVFLATSVTPDVLGLPPIAHMAALLAGWGLSSSVTPFSVLSLTASRYSEVGLYEISLGKNWAFALLNLVTVCAGLTAVVYLLG